MNDKEEWMMEWFRKGDRDLRAAKIILYSEDPLPDMVCFHAQQCVEKYLKGFLSFHGIEFPKTHDLLELLVEYCGQTDSSFVKWEKHCERLTEYAIEARYPDSSYEYSTEEAKEAFLLATRLRDFVKSKI
jgi:HEPN domain-containing protein